MGTITAAVGGGAWTTGATWVGGVAPTAADDALLTSASGNVTIGTGAVCRSLNCSTYTGTLTHTSGVTLTIGDATAGLSSIALTLVSGMTYTLGSVTSSAISFISTSSTQQTITTGGKTLGNWTVNGVGSSYLLSDSNTVGATATVTLTNGTLNTNGQTCSWGLFSSSNSNTRTLTLGASAISITGTSATSWTTSTSTNLTLNANTSTITLTGAASGMTGGGTYNNIVLSGSGVQAFSGGTPTVANFTRTGTAVKTDGLSITGSFTVTGTLTLNGNSVLNRLNITSSAIGSSRTITAATVSVTNADFTDITGAGAGSWNLAAITGNSGDGGGNSGITFTTAASQTWSGTSGGNWSANAWTSRVPLPQDDVTINAAFSASQTITADMPRLGKSVVFTGASGTPTFSNSSVPTTLYGSLTLISGMVISGSQQLSFGGRSSFTITSAGNSFGGDIKFSSPSGTYTLQDAFVTSGLFIVNNGTFTTNSQALTAQKLQSTSGLTRAMNFGSSLITLTGNSVSVYHTPTTTGLTLNAGTSKILLTDTSSTLKEFNGGNNSTFYDLEATGGGTGAIVLNSPFTFHQIKINAPKTLQFPSGQTITVSDFVATGSAGNIVTLISSTSGTTATMSKSSGIISCDYLSIKDNTVAGGAAWYAGANSTSVSNVSGWTFTVPPPNIRANMGMFG